MKVQLGSFPALEREKYLPYSSGVLESHCKKDPELQHVEFLTPLWKYGQKPEDNLDILGLTNYIWSQDHCDMLALEYKKRNPNTTIIYGGPNVPVDPTRWQEYQDERPFVDIFVAGTGEEIFKDILKNFPNVDKWHRLNKTKKYKFDTPTVYVDGTFDKFFEIDETFLATIETTRGCPFKCAFCDWGDATGSAVSKYDSDVNYQTIDTVLSSKNIEGIRIIDANWGMYSRDLDMTQYMAERKRDDFSITFCGIAKNSVKYVKDIAKIFYDYNFDADKEIAQPLKIGVQSWHPTTLKYAERDNIKEESFLKLLDFYKEHNIPYVSELIAGLPGETPDSWLYTLRKEVEYGVNFQNIYNLEVVANMPLLLNSKEAYDLTIKPVYVPKDLVKKSTPHFYHRFRDYKIDDFEVTQENRFEYIEKQFLVSCFSYDVNDLEKIYDYAWWMNTFYNTGLLKDVKNAEVEILDFFENLDQMPFWKQQVENHRACWREAFIDGKIRSAAATRYWMHTLNRCDELMNLANNFEQAQDEIGRKITPFKKELSLYTYGWRTNDLH